MIEHFQPENFNGGGPGFFATVVNNSRLMIHGVPDDSSYLGSSFQGHATL